MKRTTCFSGISSWECTKKLSVSPIPIMQACPVKKFPKLPQLHCNRTQHAISTLNTTTSPYCLIHSQDSINFPCCQVFLVHGSFLYGKDQLQCIIGVLGTLKRVITYLSVRSSILAVKLHGPSICTVMEILLYPNLVKPLYKQNWLLLPHQTDLLQKTRHSRILHSQTPSWLNSYEHVGI